MASGFREYFDLNLFLLNVLAGSVNFSHRITRPKRVNLFAKKRRRSTTEKSEKVYNIFGYEVTSDFYCWNYKNVKNIIRNEMFSYNFQCLHRKSSWQWDMYYPVLHLLCITATVAGRQGRGRRGHAPHINVRDVYFTASISATVFLAHAPSQLVTQVYLL